MAPLKEELAGMKTGALNKRAREVGVGADAMDKAADEDDPRAALIALIVAASPVMASFKLYWWNTREEIEIEASDGESAFDAVKRHCRIPPSIADWNVFLRKQTCNCQNLDEYLRNLETKGPKGDEPAIDGEDVVMNTGTMFHESRKGLGTKIPDDKPWGRGGPYDMRIYKEGGPLRTMVRNGAAAYEKNGGDDGSGNSYRDSRAGPITFLTEEETLSMHNMKRAPVTDPHEPPIESFI